MTERKRLKKLVRDRMTRTGETYSTARRHTVYERSTHRESALVRRLLAGHGLNLSEALVCGLGGGIGFLYAVFEYASVPHPLLTIVAQHHPQPWAPAVLGRLGIRYRETHSGTTATALAKLRQQAQPVLCTVDRSGLPWHHDVSPLAAADPHVVLVVEANDHTVRVDDGTEHTLPAEQFGVAWAGHRKGRHRLLSVESVPDSIDITDAVADAIATTAAHLTGPVLGNAFDVNLGFSGMSRLVADLRDRRTRKGWSRRFGDHVAYAMGRLDDCLQREYTAPDATRPSYADFLDEVERPELAALFREAGRGWHEVTRQARAGDSFDDLANGMASIMDIERRAVVRMTGWPTSGSSPT
jgi:hypothetical protein